MLGVASELTGYHRKTRSKDWFDEVCIIVLDKNQAGMRALTVETKKARNEYISVKKEVKQLLKQKERKDTENKERRNKLFSK